jgi:hypothetical protein
MQNPREQLLNRLAALHTERSGWFSHWREISDFLLPRRGRWLSGERNRGGKKNNNIIDPTGGLALRTLKSGMMAGITSPARPWFKLTTPDPDMAEFKPVKVWLERVEMLMRAVYHASNIYQSLQQVYEEVGGFGTAPMMIFSNFENVIHTKCLTVGEYYCAENHLGQIDTIYREFGMTVEQLVQEFGLEEISATARRLWDQGQYDTWVDVVHVIQPNRRMRDGSMLTDKRFMSVYIEKGADDAKGRLLAKRGFEEYPAPVPRWDLLAGDVYGRSPGMDALGEIKALQIKQRRKAEAIEKLVRPPMVAPTALRGQPSSILPGSVTYVDAVSESARFRPAYEVNPQIEHLLLDIRDGQEIINRTFYADLFLMLHESDRRQITATEVAERHEEKLLMLGPVLDRLHRDLLQPTIDRTFGVMVRAGIVPPAPQELEGIDLKVEFVSMLAQAQKMVDTASIERMAGFAGNLAAVNPEVLDVVDFDETVYGYGERLGVPAEMLRDKKAVAAMRAQRAQQVAAQQAVEMGSQAAQGAKTLSETPIRGETLLAGLLGGPGPQGAA